MTAAEKVGANLRRARKAAGIGQEECAFRAELDRTQVSVYETGGRLPKVLTLVKLAAACSVSPNDLLKGLTWESGEFIYGRLNIAEEDA
jgi:transcriptional regulator with XRE-family HTH domain